MLNREIVVRSRRAEDLRDNILGVLDAIGIEIILRVKVKVDPVITECFHVSPAAGLLAALRVWGSHVGWVLSNDVGNCSLVLHHLLLTHIRSNVRQAVVGPCMRSNLVALGNHSLDNGWIWLSLVNWSLVQVVAGHEKGSLETVCLQDIQELICIQVWTIVVGQSYDICFSTIIDIVVVCNFAKQGSRVIQSGRASRSVARVAGTESELTVGICTVSCSCPTVSLSSISIVNV